MYYYYYYCIESDNARCASKRTLVTHTRLLLCTHTHTHLCRWHAHIYGTNNIRRRVVQTTNHEGKDSLAAALRHLEKIRHYCKFYWFLFYAIDTGGVGEKRLAELKTTRYPAFPRQVKSSGILCDSCDCNFGANGTTLYTIPRARQTKYVYINDERELINDKYGNDNFPADVLIVKSPW